MSVLQVAITGIMSAGLIFAAESFFCAPRKDKQDKTIFESILYLDSIKGAEYPTDLIRCTDMYNLLNMTINFGLAHTDKYGTNVGLGDRALLKYWERYPTICSCVASGHCPSKRLLDNVEMLAIWLEVMDREER